jgi:hypothetical protein
MSTSAAIRRFHNTYKLSERHWWPDRDGVVRTNDLETDGNPSAIEAAREEFFADLLAGTQRALDGFAIVRETNFGEYILWMVRLDEAKGGAV